MEFQFPLLLRFSASCNHPAVADRNLTYEDLLRIVELIKSTSHFSEFRLKVGDIEVSLRRTNAAPLAPLAAPPPAPSGIPVSCDEIPEAMEERPFPPGAHLVRAPMVGTFYRAPQPGAAPYVEVGQAVQPDTQVGIIEVMKLMNAIAAGERGVVAEILVPNAGTVEFGQVLMVIEPQGGR
jgi:acetyl-CoA carboxylase biotin carboxyl carrier protein